MGTRKLRVGVIGVGAIATHEVHGHIPNYLRIPEVELVALSDVNGRRARYVADRFGIPQVYTHFRDMLKHADLDAVSICTPNYLHAAIAIGCLEAGVHVLVEKPMALTTQGAQKMIEAARANNAILFVGMNNRFRNDTRALKLMVEQGALGDVYYLKTGWLRGTNATELSSWFTSKAQAGGGPLWDIGLVMLDLGLWMLDFPQPASVMGAIFTGIAEPEDEDVSALVAPMQESPYPVEDAATALVRFENGTAMMLEVSWVSQLGKQDDIYMRLEGRRGAAELHNPDSGRNQKVLSVRGELFGTRMELEPEIPESQTSSHLLELQHFVDVCLGREAPVVTPEQGLMGVQIIEAIYRSATSGEMVYFDAPPPDVPDETQIDITPEPNGA
ncbi:MAG: gfo/Idh/MocA family oxidoreductase [Ardenticatenia bacterium]|nr:MAG: gfo/Idh/MocA family oxidoreductase [Ardenticatenia bacterium]